MSLIEFLRSHSRNRPISFHMPGHKGTDFFERQGYGDFAINLINYDITEIPNADNLFQPETHILEIERSYEKLYGSKKSLISINGSSAGLMASIMATVGGEDTLLLGRNSHKSVFNGIKLTGCKFSYVAPRYIEKLNLIGGISPKDVERAMEKNPSIKAVLVTSPNYYGFLSDIEAISKVVHSHEGILIVDQAHGAHLRFFDDELGTKMSSEIQGADIVINSTHKTLASLTQTAVVNIMSDRVDADGIRENLLLLESTSPSFPLMASLDVNARILEKGGQELICKWQENLKWFYNEAKRLRYLEILKPTRLARNQGEARSLGLDFAYDKTKINILVGKSGISGFKLEKLLEERNIFVELSGGHGVLCLTGIGNTKEHYQRLIDALVKIEESTCCSSPRGQGDEIDASNGEKDQNQGTEQGKEDYSQIWKNIMDRISQNRVAGCKWSGDKRPMQYSSAIGKISADAIIPYPPGIPVICPGEIIEEELIKNLESLRNMGYKVLGMEEGTINIIENSNH